MENVNLLEELRLEINSKINELVINEKIKKLLEVEKVEIKVTKEIEDLLQMGNMCSPEDCNISYYKLPFYFYKDQNDKWFIVSEETVPGWAKEALD